MQIYCGLTDHFMQVTTQRRHWENMENIGWVCDEFLSGPCPELEVLLGQYTTFLEYLADREKTYLIPSAEVDLIWHTHQLSPFRYRWDHLFVCQFQLVNIIWQRDDTLALLGVFVDHLCHEEDLASYCTSAFQIKSKKIPLTQYQIGEMMQVLMCGTYVFVALWPMTKKTNLHFSGCLWGSWARSFSMCRCLWPTCGTWHRVHLNWTTWWYYPTGMYKYDFLMVSWPPLASIFSKTQLV